MIYQTWSVHTNHYTSKDIICIFLKFAKANHLTVCRFEIVLLRREFDYELILAILFRPLVYCSQTPLNYLAFQYFDIEQTWWMLIHRLVVQTKFDIYICITIIMNNWQIQH